MCCIKHQLCSGVVPASLTSASIIAMEDGTDPRSTPPLGFSTCAFSFFSAWKMVKKAHTHKNGRQTAKRPHTNTQNTPKTHTFSRRIQQ